MPGDRSRLGVFVTALLAVAAARAESSKPSGTPDELFDRGVQFQHAGNLEEARRAYESALKLAPERVDVLSNLGLTDAGLHRYDQAIQCFQRALTVQPKQPAVLFNLGLTYLQAGKPDQARANLEEVLTAHPDLFVARRFLGIALLQQDRVAEGVSELEAVTRSHPEDLQAVYTLASAYIKLQALSNARALIEGPIHGQDTGPAHLIAGCYYMAAQNFRQAVVELKRARELDATLPDLAVELGGAYAVTGSQKAAIPLLEARLRDHPSDYESLCLLGWMYLEADRLVDASAMLERARILQPDDPALLFQVARLARSRGDLTKAVRLLERVVANRPDYLQAHVLLAQSYFKLNRREDGQRERQIVSKLTAEDQARRLQQAQIDQGAQARP